LRTEDEKKSGEDEAATFSCNRDNRGPAHLSRQPRPRHHATVIYLGREKATNRRIIMGASDGALTKAKRDLA